MIKLTMLLSLLIAVRVHLHYTTSTLIRRVDYVAQRTYSGYFGQNTVLTHVAQDDLPFGGVGASGMGNIMVQKVSSVCRMNGQ